MQSGEGGGGQSGEASEVQSSDGEVFTLVRAAPATSALTAVKLRAAGLTECSMRLLVPPPDASSRAAAQTNCFQNVHQQHKGCTHLQSGTPGLAAWPGSPPPAAARARKNRGREKAWGDSGNKSARAR